MSERHMREARALMEAAHEAVSDGCVDAWRACEARAAAALRGAELRGIRAGMAAARERVFDAAAAIHSIDPASVDVEP